MNFGMNEMLKEAQRMQEELAKAHDEPAIEVVEASAGGDMVTVTGQRCRRDPLGRGSIRARSTRTTRSFSPTSCSLP
jgi:hypothetical protein